MDIIGRVEGLAEISVLTNMNWINLSRHAGVAVYPEHHMGDSAWQQNK